MNVLPSTMLLLAMSSGVVFCHTGPSRDPQPLFSARHDVATADFLLPSIGTLTLHTEIHALSVTPDKTNPPLPPVLRVNCYFGKPSTPAPSRIPTPFNYTVAKDGLEYFPIKIGPLRYTFWSGNSRFDRPGGGRLQNLIDGVLRHYTSDPVVPVNKRCLRSLSCNSPYEQALRQRTANTEY